MVRQQKGVHSGAQTEGHDGEHCEAGHVSSGYWSGTGHIDGYGRDGEMEHEDVPHG